MPTAERFTAPFAYHGEGPFWDTRRNRLMCMDVLAAAVVTIDSDGQFERHNVPSRAATAIRRRAGSGFVISTAHDVLEADDELADFRPLAAITDDPMVRTNDGGCDPLGAFVIGTMSVDGRPGRGAVYRVTPDGATSEILAPVSISNGVQWSDDGARVYYIDTPTRRVDIFDVDPETGEWSNRRVHVSVNHAEGMPDGMAIDIEGGLWVALWGGGAVHHYDNTGRHVDTVHVPGVRQVSSCAFGGSDGNLLYVTTSRQGLRSDEEPDAGAVYVIPTSTKGARQCAFGGVGPLPNP